MRQWIPYEFIALLLTTLFFGFHEKSVKEDWVLIDSFRKSQKMYIKLANSSSFPIFIIDLQGKFLELNSEAYSLLKLCLNPRTFYDIVHPSYKEKITIAFKNISKDLDEKMEIPLKAEISDPSLITGYDFYLLHISRFVWKTGNCIKITCQNIMKDKLSHQLV